MRNNWKTIWALVLCAATALAEPDTLGLGTGRDGPLVVTEPRRIINHYAQVTAPLAPGDTVLFVAAAEGFSAGDLVMVLQTTGIVPEPRRGEPGPIELTHDPVGRWELARVEAARGGEVWLTAPLIHSYAASVTQVIRVPEYTSVEVRPGASVVAKPWDGATGGVLAFLASGTIRNDGALQASGAGFRGGVAGQQPFDLMGCSLLPREVRAGARRGEGISSLSYGPLETGLDNASNGGGGGLCPMSGGGGGGNGAAGGRGGDARVPWDTARDLGGLGGAALSYSMLDHLTLGGGGGRGHGAWEGNAQAGAGGGAIFIRGQRLTGKGTIAADGEDGEQSAAGGGSGGGAGGSLYLRLAGSAECASVSARGGAGGSAGAAPGSYTGPGGGGGGGRVLYQAAGADACPISVAAGTAGGETLSNGATEAGAGTVTRLVNGFTAMLGACGGQTPEFVRPKHLNSVNDTTPLFEVKLPLNPAATDNYVVRITLDQNGKEENGDPVLGTATRDGTNNLWRLDPLPAAALQPGVNGIRAIAALDCGTGQPDTNSAIISIFVDVTNPITVIEGKPASLGNSTSATFTYKVTNEERDVLFKCKLDNDPEENCGVAANNTLATKAYNNLTEGPHTFAVYAIDAAGSSGTAVSHPWTIDLTPPVTEITSKPPPLTKQTQANFQFQGGGTGGKYFCKLDSGPVEPCDSGSKSYPVTEGLRTFCVYAVDAATNADTSPECYSWTVDTTPPVTVITQKPRPSSKQTEVTFLFEGAGTDGQYMCKLDTGTYGACDSGSKTYSALTEASHTFCVYATDKAGNDDSSAECYTWTVDLTPPVTVITKSPDSPSNQTTATFEFQGAGTGGKYWCSLDAGAYVSCDSGSKSYSPLIEKQYTFCVYSVDAATNQEVTPVCYTWTVDITAPEVTIDPTSKPRDPSNSSSVTFKYSASEAGSALFCKLDQEVYGPCGVNEKTYTNLPDGSRTFCVYAQDPAGNKNEPAAACYTWVVDRTPPDSVIGQKPSNPSNKRTVNFTFTGAGNDGKYWCKLDTGSEASCDSGSVEYPNLLEGTHTFCVRARDAAGNDEVTAECYTWNTDLTEPDTVIDANRPANPTRDTTAQFTFTGAGNNGKYWCTLDGGAPESCDSGSKSYPKPGNPPLGEGTHTFCVKAVDAAGNEDSTPACYTWTVDLTPPNTQIGSASKPENPTNSRSAAFEYAGAGPQGSYRCKLDADQEQICDPDGIQYTQLLEGPHTFCVYAIDAAGNRDATPDCYTWRVDLTAPNTAIAAGKPADPTNVTSATFTFTSTEAGSQFRCQLDNVPAEYEQCNFGIRVYTALGEGPHTFCVYAIDPAKNNDPSPDCYTWNIDLTPPDTVIEPTSKPADPTNVTSATFFFRGAESGGHYRCKLSQGSNPSSEEPCDSGSKTYNPVPEGVNTFTVYAVDAAGNKDPSPATHIWNVDITKPDTVIDPTSKPRNPTNETSATFKFTGAGPGGKYQCSLNAALAEDCSSGQKEYTGLAPRSHTFCVYAVDSAGNADPTADCHTWVVDLALPDTVIDPTSEPASPTNQASVTFRFTGAGAGGRYWCKLDGDPKVAKESCGPGEPGSRTYTSLADGAHTFCVYAENAAGSEDPTSDCHTWVVDVTPPETVLDAASRPRDPTNLTSVAFRFTSTESPPGFMCRLDSGTYEDCSSGTFVRNGLTELPRPHSFCVYAKDEAGNADPTPECHSWVIDVTPPETSITSKPPNPSKSRDAVFLFSSNEGGSKFTCKLDGAQTGEVCDSGRKEYTNLTEGEHIFCVVAEDPATNMDPVPECWKWVVDVTPPDTVIDGVSEPNPTNQTSITFQFSGAGPGEHYRCRLNGGLWEPCDSGEKTYTGLTERQHTFFVKAMDAAGNEDPTPATHFWRVDLTLPTVVVTSPTARKKINTSLPEFTGSSEENSTVSVSITLNGVTETRSVAASNEGAWTLTTQRSLPDGLHSAVIGAKDLAGNSSAAEVEVEFIVDTKPPETKCVSGPPPIDGSRKANFEFDAPGESPQESIVFACTVLDVATGQEQNGNCKSNEQTINVATLFGKTDVNGDYVLRAIAEDEAGNRDSSPCEYKWTIIVDPPVAPEFLDPVDGAIVYSLQPTISGKASRLGTVDVYLDGTKVGPANVNAQLEWDFAFPKELAEGTYSLQGVLTDVASNPSVLSPPITFTVRAPKPQAHAMGGGLGCASSGMQPGLALLGVIAAAMWRSRQRRR